MGMRFKISNAARKWGLDIDSFHIFTDVWKAFKPFVCGGVENLPQTHVITLNFHFSLAKTSSMHHHTTS